MFISSLIAVAASGAWAAECADGDTSCDEREPPPLVILQPTSSPEADEEVEEAKDAPPLVILPPTPSPGVDRDVREAPAEDDEQEAICEGERDEDDDCVVVVTDADRKDRRRGKSQFVAQYALQFLGQGPAHHLLARAYTPKDTYLGAELRYLPNNDAILWSGRVGAGVDLLGASPFDVQLGLFLGSAGEWFVLDGGDAIYSSPILGSEVRFAFEGRRFVTSYRLIGGFGVGPLQRFLSEREFIVGYKVTERVQLFGETVRINPRSGDSMWSLGLGGRFVF
ncbi:MAG: hypothetical protein AAF211_25870 [Myxococcota bacterium]